jgi:enoyl-CoA hydratase
MHMQSNELTVVNKDDGSVWITINRPHKHNALSRGVLGHLQSAVTQAGEEPRTRCVVLTGAGEAYFAAGGDLIDLGKVRDLPSTQLMIDEARDALDSIRQCPVPVVAVLNGDAIGGGAELALACDMRLQSATARIGFVQARLAITSAWGGGTDLCQLVGASRALRMMCRCELIGASQALDWGLTDAVVSDGPNGVDVQEFLKPLLHCSPRVLRGIKAQTFAARSGMSYESRRAIEQRELLATWLHDDHWVAAEKILKKTTQ